MSSCPPIRIFMARECRSNSKRARSPDSAPKYESAFLRRFSALAVDGAGFGPVGQQNGPFALNEVRDEARQRNRTRRYDRATEADGTPQAPLPQEATRAGKEQLRARCEWRIKSAGSLWEMGLCSPPLSCSTDPEASPWP